MRNDYTLGNNVKNSVGRFIKVAYILSMTIYALLFIISAVLLVVKLRITLSREFIFLFILLNSLPLLLGAFSIYIYEDMYKLKKMSNQLKLKVTAWFFYLILPSVFLLYRFDPVFDTVEVSTFSILLTALIYVIGGSSFDIINSKNLQPFVDIKYIMHDFWCKSLPNKLFEKKHFNDVQLDVREHIYYEKRGIDIFQRSISCPLLDAKAALTLGDYSQLKNQLSILDIGGCDGQFTTAFLEGLTQKTGATIGKIQLVDPVDFSDRYRHNTRHFINSSNVHYEQEKFENWDLSTDENYDVIVASHSLYSVVDNNNLTVAQLREKLKLFKSSRGKIITVLSTRESRAYSFKNEILRNVLGVENTDLDSVKFKQEINERHVAIKVDNIIDLTEYLRKYRNGDNTDLVSWLSYFLRVDPKTLQGHTLQEIVDILKYYSQPLYELPEEKVKYYSTNAFPQSHVDKNSSIILCHKTEVIIF